MKWLTLLGLLVASGHINASDWTEGGWFYLYNTDAYMFHVVGPPGISPGRLSFVPDKGISRSPRNLGPLPPDFATYSRRALAHCHQTSLACFRGT